MKRLTRHEMKEPDQFLVAVEKGFSYVRQNPNPFFAAAGGFVLLILGGLVWSSVSHARSESANDALAELLTTAGRPIATAGSTDADTFPDHSSKDNAIMEEADVFLAEHSPEAQQRATKMLKAHALANRGRHADAAKLFDEVAGPQPSDSFAVAAAVAGATSRAAAGEAQESVDRLKRLASGNNPHIPKALVLERAAQISESAGNLDEALSLYRRLVDEAAAPGSSARAQAKVTELEKTLGLPASPANDDAPDDASTP